jgi:hypothetical protein
MPSPKIPRTCDVCGTDFLSDATNAKRSRGGHYCSRKCYYLRHGSTLEERFWRKVKKSEGCWEWQGWRDDGGYGSIGSFGNADRVKTHRYSWQLHNGPIPDDLLVCHTCDNPPCVRPDHLFLGTHLDNMRDKMKKGRHKAGRRTPNHPPASA